MTHQLLGSGSILTAGYGNRGLEGFVQLMKNFGVTHIVDVRSVPSSRYWTEFRRENLMDSIPSAGFKYVYMGDTLGGVQNSPVLCQEPESVEISPLLVQPRLQIGIEALLKAAAFPQRQLCLMCGCKQPMRCHRSRLLGVKLLEVGVDLVHIMNDDSVLRQSELPDDLIGTQHTLF